MWDLAINGVDFYHIANWFYIYSFLGWLWETCYVSVRKGKLINRGFINGPLCTIYGCGALAVYLILLPISDNLLLLFVGGVVVATALEYVTAVLMENIFHTSWWDYSDNKFNFQGRICLGCSLGWGVFTVGLFRVLHPVVSGIYRIVYQKNWRGGCLCNYSRLHCGFCFFCSCRFPFARAYSCMGAGTGSDACRTACTGA